MWINKKYHLLKNRNIPQFSQESENDKPSKDWFLKERFQKDKQHSDTQEAVQGATEQPKQDVFECKKCGAKISKAETVANKYVCKECGYYFRIRTKNRIRMVADAGTFEPWFEDIEETNPLDFPGYEEKLAQIQEKTKLKEGVTVGYARIDGEPVVLGVCDARFLMGSMGHVVGEKIACAVEKATAMRLPVILFCCSGGAKTQRYRAFVYSSADRPDEWRRDRKLCDAWRYDPRRAWRADRFCRAKGD